jgi:hypothetical protein
MRPTIDDICERESFDFAIRRDMVYGENEAEETNDALTVAELDAYCTYNHLHTNVWDDVCV